MLQLTNILLLLAMVRDCPVGQDYFEKNRSTILSTLKQLVESSNTSVVMKSCVVLRHLCLAKQEIKEDAIKLGFVPIVKGIENGSDDETTQEMATLALSSLN